MHFTRKDQDKLKQIALAPTGSTGWRDDAVAFGASREQDGVPVAVAVFQAFTGREAEFHIAMLDGARMQPAIVASMLTMSFSPRGLNLDRLWCQIAVDNPTAQVAAIKVGFQIEYRKRGGIAGGKDAIVFSMARTGTGQAAAKHPNDEDADEVNHGR
ncbi:GNAT family N-acetyltransferase [Cypionkella sp.]|uniref:GNAT family N-acetyltransferase n=1 Tax=Cypionkella sp. TaxID=2811411 RepID=UPI002719CFBF|nr:hypothetical protein [Cypionkella sp.]MDO8983013.1 hypothetical protein [Cypionkella sp.]